MSEGDQFDALVGGTVELPSSLAIAKFVACRSQEIQSMKQSLRTRIGSKLAFQSLPNHMRRRAMSHNVKRLPRRLRQIHLNQLKKSGLPTKQKRPSRKYRRRPKQLIEEYTKRANSKYKWLQTHIWHAKRFHMIQKWGYKLPLRSCEKSFRACYRALSQHCLLQDISYLRCIEISGSKEVIIKVITPLYQSDLSIDAKAFIKGNREGHFTLSEFELPQRPIGQINFQWEPNTDLNPSKLWLWIHPSFYNTAINCLKKSFTDFLEITITELDSKVSRFRLTGPLSSAILGEALKTTKFEDLESINCYSHKRMQLDKLKQDCTEQYEFWNCVKDFPPNLSVTPHLVVSLLVEDPRMHLAYKKTKPVCNTCLDNFSPPEALSGSLLWFEDCRKVANEVKLSDLQVSELRSKLLVPGSSLKTNNSLIPVVLIQRPGNRTHHIGLGGGWDIILPSAWAKTFWIALVMRGARVGGLRETKDMAFEMGRSQELYPDTTAGLTESLQTDKEKSDIFFRKPPNKRTNYNKFKISSPFNCNWELLMKDWSGSDRDIEEFFVLRNKKQLLEINEYLSANKQIIPNCLRRHYLIPIKIVAEIRGCPSEFSIICLPKSQQDLKLNVQEPTSLDILQEKRKLLRKSHQLLLKKIQKKKKANKEVFDHNEHLKNYQDQIRALWLPKATEIRHSCSREVIGFVTKGGFSFSLGKSSATGFIISDSLVLIKKFQNTILFRNTNSRQYYKAKLTIILE